MGKNLARMELQVFLQELSQRLPHMKLQPQRFSYLSNMSFRGPEHLLVEWDPAANPERRDPYLLQHTHPVRIGESTRANLSRVVSVEHREKLAHDTVGLTLVAADGKALAPWTPGAHIDVDCGDTGLTRQYSLSGDPADRMRLHIAVLKDPHSRGGSAWLHTQLAEGDVLQMRGPRNHFQFDETAASVVFVAAGIGVTPVLTMARQAQQLGMDYVFHYSARSREHMAFVQELQALHGGRLHLHISAEGTRADFAALLKSCKAGTQVYACGPQSVLQTLETVCAQNPGVLLKLEHFQAAATALDPAKEHGFEIELKDSGLLLSVPPDRTVMQTLRAANIDIQSDCGEGLCGSCEVRVLAGQVDHRDMVLTAAERAQQNKMMVCCSRSASGRLVLEL
jgi:hypothetical protein